jgi:hypothetical protein
MGQVYPVNVYAYVCERTIEERIETILREKQALFDAIVDDAGIDLSAYLSGDDLFGLFGLRDPRAEAPSSSPATPDYARLTAAEFEARVGRILERRGWQVAHTPRGHDGGIDLIATRTDDLGAEDVLYVQCKHQATPLGVGVVRELNGAIQHRPGVRGAVACPAGASAEARAFARERGIILWDAQGLRELERTAGGGGA